MSWLLKVAGIYRLQKVRNYAITHALVAIQTTVLKQTTMPDKVIQ